MAFNTGENDGFNIGNIFGEGGLDLGNFGAGGLGRSLLGAGLGAGLGALFAPKAPTFTAPTAAQLDAAVIPEMERQAQLRTARLLGAQGAKGGASSADVLERTMLGQELARGIGMQQASNLAQAQAAANQVAQAQAAARRQRLQDIMSGGAFGYNIFNPIDQER